MQLVGDDFYTLIKVRIIVIKEFLVCFRFLKRMVGQAFHPYEQISQ